MILFDTRRKFRYMPKNNLAYDIDKEIKSSKRLSFIMRLITPICFIGKVLITPCVFLGRIYNWTWKKG